MGELKAGWVGKNCIFRPAENLYTKTDQNLLVADHRLTVFVPEIDRQSNPRQICNCCFFFAADFPIIL